MQVCDTLSQLYLCSNSVKFHSGSLMQEVRAFLLAPSLSSMTFTSRSFITMQPDERVRHIQSEMWCGRNWLQHFSGPIASSILSTEKLSFLSAFPASVLASVPSASEVTRPDFLLHSSNSEAECMRFSHVSPLLASGSKAVDVYVVTNRPAHITTLGLVIKTDSLSPLAMDVYIGETVDTSRLVLQDVKLPQCPSGTHLYFELDDADPASDVQTLPSDSPYAMSLAQYAYDYRGLRRKRSYPPLSRIVRLVFRGGSPYLVLGTVEIYGVTAFPTVSPEAARYKVRSAELSRAIDHTVQEACALDNGLLSPLPVTANAVAASALGPTTRATTKHGGAAPVAWKQTEPVRRTSSLSPTAENEHTLICERQLVALQSAQPAELLAAVEQPPSTSAHGEYLARATELLQAHHAIEHISFDQCLQLEQLRVVRGITERNRDLLLAQVDRDGSSYLLDPNRFFYTEPFPSPSARRLNQKKSTTCQNHECGASIGFFSQPLQCMYCALWLCANCMHAEKRVILEFLKVESEPAQICTQCAVRLQFQTHVLQQLRNSALLCRSEFEEISYTDWKTLFSAQQMAAADVSLGGGAADQLTVVSTYPFSAVLLRVPTAVHSPPIESLFFDTSLDACGFYWQGPAGVSVVHVLVVLSYQSAVHRVNLLVDPKGYTAEDEISVQFAFGQAVDDLVTCGTWDVPQCAPGSRLSWIPPAAPISCRLVSCYIRLKTPRPDTMLHLGRLKIIGRFEPTPPVQGLTDDSPIYKKALLSAPSRPITPVRANAPRFSADHLSFEISFNQTSIHAFCVTFLRLNARTCWLQVLGYYTPESAANSTFLTTIFKQSKSAPLKGVSLGRFLLPKTTSVNTQLVFSLKESPALLDSIVFRFELPNAMAFSLPKVTLLG